MRIAIVSQPLDIVEPTTQANSLPIWTNEVSRRMAKSADVTVFCRKVGSKGSVEWHDGVQYRAVRRVVDVRVMAGVHRRLMLFLSKILDLMDPRYGHDILPFWSALYCFSYILQVALAIRKHRYDIVHVLNYSQFAPILRLLNPHLKIVLNMRCDWLMQLDAEMIAARLRHVDLIIGCSDYITEGIEKRFPEHAFRCQTVHNGVDVERFVPSSRNEKDRDKDAKTLLYVGRISPEKGLHVLLKAFKKVLERFPDVRLDIVGPTKGALPLKYIVAYDDPAVQALSEFYERGQSQYFPLLEKEMVELNLRHRVTFHGGRRQAELVHYYQDASVFIFPSICNEAFGIPLVEAMACALPAVASRCGGITEIVKDGKTGLLVNRDNPEALAEAICLLLSDAALRRFMGQASRQSALTSFSWESIATRLQQAYGLMAQRQAIGSRTGNAGNPPTPHADSSKKEVRASCMSDLRPG